MTNKITRALVTAGSSYHFIMTNTPGGVPLIEIRDVTMDNLIMIYPSEVEEITRILQELVAINEAQRVPEDM